MDEMRKLRAEGKVGKESANVWGAGAKDRQDAREAAELKRAAKLRKAVGMAGPEQRALAQRMVDAAARKRDRALTPKEEAKVDAKLGRNRPSRVAEGVQREEMRKDRAERTGTARKPRATTAETKPAWKETEAKVKEARAEAKRVGAETKGDKSPEARKRRLEAGRAVDKAERAAQKASDRYLAAAKRESLKAMTPEQRKEEREWNKTKNRLG
jgi:hypothetical protein